MVIDFFVFKRKRPNVGKDKNTVCEHSYSIILDRMRTSLILTQNDERWVLKNWLKVYKFVTILKTSVFMQYLQI